MTRAPRPFLLSIALLSAPLLPGPAGRAEAGDAAAPWAFTAPRPRPDTPAAPAEPLETAEERQARQEKLKQHLADAQAAALAQDWPRANEAVKAALQMGAGRPETLSAAGQIYLLQGDYEQALPCWTRLRTLLPRNAAVETALGATYFYMDRFDEADRVLGEVLKRTPDETGARFYLAALHTRQGRHSEAEETLATPNLAGLWQAVSSLHEERQPLLRTLTPQGYATFCRLVLANPALDPTPERMQQLKATLREALEHLHRSAWTDAAQALRQAVQDGARAPSVAYNLALCLYKATPTPEQLARVEQVVAAKPSGATFARAFVYLCLGAEDYARAERGLAHMDGTGDDESILMRAAIQSGRGQPSEAWRILDSIPVERRGRLVAWFDNDLPAIRALRANPSFEAWRPDAPAPPSAP